MNQPPNRTGSRSASASNSAGARGAVLLVVASVLGIGLLQAFDTDFDGGGGLVAGGGGGGTTVPSDNGSSGSTVPTTPTNTTLPARPPAEVTVLVANGSGIRGLGSQNGDTLKALGYNTLAAVDATRALDISTVQFADGYQTEAQAIALTLGLPPAAVVPLNSPPVSDTQGASVFVLLGADVGRTASSSSSTTSTTL